MPAALRDPRSLGLALCGVAAALLYSNFVLDWIEDGFHGMTHVVSELEAPGEPNATLLRITDVVCAVLVLVLLPWVRRGLPKGAWREVVVWATVAFSVCAVVAAVVTKPCGPHGGCDVDSVQNLLHDGSSIVSDGALYVGAVAAWFSTRRTGPAWFHRSAAWNFWVGGVAAAVVFEAFNLAMPGSWVVGFSQRLHIVCISVWIATLGFFAALTRVGTEAAVP